MVGLYLLGVLAARAQVTLLCQAEVCEEVWVGAKQQGDGICDLNCMSAPCNFDREVGSEDVAGSDCALACVLLGCDQSLLGNGKCDSSCLFVECGWDWGDCGLCNENCELHAGFQSNLKNGVCEEQCNTTACKYDGGDCGDCAAGCFEFMINNSVCNSACKRVECDYDGNDCLADQCAPGCFPDMVGDLVCQPACHVPACSWDATDCDCSPGCVRELLQNEQCDELCASRECRFDNGLCVRASQGDCAKDCFSSMIGNDRCDPVCNRAECSWDGLDCGCAPQCDVADYGLCKLACMMPSCGYDAMPGFPACLDELTRLMNRATHNAVKSTLLQYSYDVFCAPVAMGCTLDTWRASFTTCQPACAIFDTCASSFGNCEPSCRLVAHCDRCSVRNCLRCEAGYLTFFEVCQLNCPVSFTVDPLVPGQCAPGNDDSSHSNPVKYYVSATAAAGGIGSLADPFSTLSHALAAVQFRFVHIYLLHGVHDLSEELANSYIRSQRYDYVYGVIPYRTDNHVEVWPLSCSEVAHPECVEDYAVLRFVNTAPVLLHLRGHVEFWNIRFEGSTTLVPGCTSEICTYCPRVVMSAGVPLNDRQVPLTPGTYAPQTACDSLHSSSLINIEPGAEIEFYNVTFANFRQQLRSLISFTTGSVLLSNVSFANVSASEAVVLMGGVALSGHFQFAAGSVRLLNNGYEYVAGVTYPGFFLAEGADSVQIEGVLFEMNHMGVSGKLITVTNVLSLSIARCTFHDNFGRLLSINSAITLPTAIDSSLRLIDFYQTHISVSGSAFTTNSAASLISITFSGDLQNVEIRDSTFDLSLSTTAGVIAIASVRALRQYEVSGQKLSVVNGGKRVRVDFPSMWVHLSGLKFARTSVSGNGLIYLSKLANVRVADCLLSTSGESTSSRDFFTATLQLYMNSQETYMSRPAAGLQPAKCRSILFLETIAGLDISGLQVTESQCDTAGIVATEVTKSAVIATSLFKGNFANTEEAGAVLDLTVATPMTLDSIEVIRNTNQASNGSGIVSLASPAHLITVLRSRVAENSFPTGGAVKAVGAIFIAQTSVEANSSSGNVAAGLVYSPAAAAAQLRLLDTDFVNNISTTGAALTLIDNSVIPIPVELSIESCTFDRNVSERGACIYIYSAVRLTTNSVISRSRFTNNSAGNSCIYESFLGGVLTVTGSEFRWNSSPTYAVLFAAHPASTPTEPSRVVLVDTVIEYNSGTAMVGFGNHDSRTEGESRNLTMRHNIGRGVYLQWTSWRDTNSLFLNNSASDQSPCFVLLSACTVSIRNSTFQDNQSGENAGAVYAGAHSVLDIANSKFHRNHAVVSGGAMYTDQRGQLVISDCEFVGNTADSGAALFFFSGTLNTVHSVSGSVFRENWSTTGVAGLISANAIFANCTVCDNAAQETAGLLVYISAVRITGSRFCRQTGNIGTFLSSPASSTIEIVNTVFEEGAASDEGGAMYVSSSVLNVTNSLFRNLTATAGSAIEAHAESIIHVNWCTFTHLSTVGEAAMLFIPESTGVISHSRFEYFNNGAIAGETSQFSIDSCEFVDGRSVSGAALSCEVCEYVYVRNSYFHRLTAETVAAIFLAKLDSVEIENCVFEENQGETAGAVVIEDANAQVSNSLFTNNSAHIADTGRGGGLSLWCESKQTCEFAVTNSEFSWNYAGLSGGAVVWSPMQPTFAGNTFHNNSAQYGADIASFAVRLSTPEADFQLAEVPSGQDSPTAITVELLDHYNRTLTTDNSSMADLFPVNTTDTTVTGSTRIVAARGVFEFSSFQVSHMPGHATAIKVQTNGALQRVADLVIPVRMRLCEPGEALMSSVCFPCGKGEYSLVPSQPCTSCPQGGQCFGRAVIAPKAGYWRSHSDTAKFWKCPNTDSCLEVKSEEALQWPTGRCLKGYFGNMCNGCVNGFSRTSRGSCSKCPERVANIVRIIGVGVAALLIVVFVIKMSLISAHRVRSQYSIYLKIFLNYLQLVTVTSTIDLAWPTYVLEIFKVQENAGNVSDQVFSFDCFISTGDSTNQQSVVFYKVVILTSVPLFIFLCSFLFWSCVALFTHSRHYLKYELVNSMVVLFFVAHPSLVKAMFDMFNCKEIDSGEFWLSLYLNIRCWDRQHSRYALLVALPGLILWGIFTPAVALVLLIRAKKQQLDDLNTRIRFGFLYNGYRAESYYWEFVIMYRKMVIIIFAVFFTNISTEVQSLCVMLILVVAFILQMKQAPFQLSVFNQLEQRAILVATVTIYCGLFFISDGIDTWSQLALFIVILAANVYFVLLWLVKTGKAGWLLLREWLLRLKLLRRPQAVYPLTENARRKPGEGMSLSLSGVRVTQLDEGSWDASSAAYRRTPKESSIIQPSNTPAPAESGSLDKQ